MRGKDLLECIEQIDDALVEEAMEPTAFPHRGIHWFRGSVAAKWGMAVACAVVLGISATAFWSHQNIKSEHLEHTGEDSAAGYPMAMDASADDGSAGTGNSSEGSLTAGAATKDKKEASDGDDAVHEGAISGSGDTVRDGVAADGSNITRERATADGENDTAREEAAADGGNNDLRQETASDNSEDTSSQSSAMDAMADKESTKVQDIEEAVTESAKLQYTVISDYYGEKDGSVYDYPVPDKGEVICYHYLDETMKHYAGLEDLADDTDDWPIYAYDVVIDVYGDMEMGGGQDVRYGQLNFGDIKAGYEKLDQEYMRLTDLGYAVQLAEDFRLTGTFTKVEIDTFQASPEYGYVFRFADEF